MSLADKEFIIIHHSLTKDGTVADWNAIRRYHVDHNKWADIGYHFGIELIRDAGGGSHVEILLGRMLGETAAAVKEQNMNRRGVHICFVGNFDDMEPSAQMWEAGVKLVRSLLDILGINADKIEGHRTYTNKSCPGTRFDVQRFAREVAGRA